MKFLLLILFLAGVGYAWFSFYQPRPASGTMGGTIQEFMEAINKYDIPGMRRLCAPEAQEDCNRIIQEIRDGEAQAHSTLSTVGSIGFDYARGRHRVDGQVNAVAANGQSLLSSIVVVEQTGDNAPWRIVTIR